jgi:hypothetical protein
MTFLPETTIEHLIDWDRTRQGVSPWIGERAATLFAYAISRPNGSAACAAYFRGILEAAGDDPDSPQVTEAEQLLIDWGDYIGTSPDAIPDAFYQRLESTFTAERRLSLLEFAGRIVSANVMAMTARLGTAE